MKTRKKYNFILEGGSIIPVEAYTKKQAVAYFRLKHGKLHYCNILKEKHDKDAIVDKLLPTQE